MTINSPVIFDINDFIDTNRVFEEEKEEKKVRKNDFQEAVILVKEYFEELYTSDRLTDEEKRIRQEIEHNAILGDEKAQSILVPEIKEFLQQNNLQGITHYDFFDSLASAIFHEIYGFGVFYKWEKLADSPSAKIIGKEIWFKVDGQFVKQQETLRNDEHVYEILRALEVANKGFKINESNPRAEIEMKNGTRVTISIPPASFKPVIVFRRFIVKSFSFLEQAKRKTIALEDVEFFNDLSKLYLNTIIAGHVESGKSTMLKTFYGARDSQKVAVNIEPSPESYFKRDFPERLVHDLYTLDDIEGTIRLALRIDHDFIMFQEVRGIEAEGAMKATERGSTGLLMTYHITDPANTPEQIAGHIVDEFPNRRLSNEIRRVSRQLDIGITMETFEGNQKKITTVYEVCYNRMTDKAWINYLIKYNEKSDCWEYNSNISYELKKKIFKFDEKRAEKVISHLLKMSKLHPITEETVEEIIFKD
ncbi:ATPase, T2SS/T4P/T4SS family [Robertmurraya massiliosenegalensis]|uniref:ATPase, T2SS/T4P/T4SS family n=1 Tax=Robertmurraya massiliosenegalensis TaxID=1287657 RepID=UPI0002E34602|nr:ATPase, T2SS/T4P/T4SS family [Robertmurraya massiliosenegalensis]